MVLARTRRSLLRGCWRACGILMISSRMLPVPPRRSLTRADRANSPTPLALENRNLNQLRSKSRNPFIGAGFTCVCPDPPRGQTDTRAVWLLRRHYGWGCPVLPNVRPPQAGTYANPGLWRGQAASCADHRGGNCLSGLWTSLGGEAHQAIKKAARRAAFRKRHCLRGYFPANHRSETEHASSKKAKCAGFRNGTEGKCIASHACCGAREAVIILCR